MRYISFFLFFFLVKTLSEVHTSAKHREESHGIDESSHTHPKKKDGQSYITRYKRTCRLWRDVHDDSNDDKKALEACSQLIPAAHLDVEDLHAHTPVLDAFCPPV